MSKFPANWPSPDNYDEWDDWAKALVRVLSRPEQAHSSDIGMEAVFFATSIPPDEWLELFVSGTHTFDVNSYPALAAKLGGNVLPNYTLAPPSGGITCIKAA